MIFQFINSVGTKFLNVCNGFGQYALFVVNTGTTIATEGFSLKKLLTQMERIGVDSLPICALIGIFSGAVLTLQTYSGFSNLVLKI